MNFVLQILMNVNLIHVMKMGFVLMLKVVMFVLARKGTWEMAKETAAVALPRTLSFRSSSSH